MDRAPWRDRVGPPIALLMTAMLLTAVAPAAISAGVRPPVPPPVDCQVITPASAARAAHTMPRGQAPVTRAQAQLDRRGELTSRQLSVRTSSGAQLSVALPIESFVGPVVGSVLVYTRDAATGGSEVRALNLESGCDVRLAAPQEIVRSAILDPSATAVYAHSVTRAGRQDAGVVRHDLETGVATPVVPPLPPSDYFGPTFGTELHWSVAGDALAVQSCGVSSCRTRILDIATGQVVTLDGLGQGAFVGLARGALITFADCLGLPCAVLSTDRTTGAVTTLAEEALAATLTPTTAGGALLTIETAAGTMEVAL